MHTMSHLIIGTGTYAEQRKARKLGFYAGYIFFLKSMIGLGIFSIPVGFSRVGYILGIMICILSMYVVGVMLYKLVILAEKIEEEHNIKIQTYDQ